MSDTVQQAEQAFARGDFDAAARALCRVLETNPDEHKALALLAEVRLLGNDSAEAFALITRAVNAAPEIHPYKKRFLELARRGLAVADRAGLENAIVACLRTPDLAGLLENWAQLLMADPRFNAAYGLVSRRPFDPANGAFFSRPMELKPLLRDLFLEGIKNHVVCDPVFEAFITAVRRQLLDELDTKSDRLTADEHLVLASALSHYAFLTDFILDETEDERRRIDRLRRRIETEPAAASEAALAVMACYRPLRTLSNATEIHETFLDRQPLAEIVSVQIADHIALRERALSIASITPIDESSAVVRRQYEDFPYPRWKKLSPERIAEEWRDYGLSETIERLLPTSEPAILVAGCGTGRDAVILSAMCPGATVTALDISRTSLAYAALRAEEHGAKNIAFLHGDILHLAMMGQNFDYICCTGVLHHMQNPAAGLAILHDLLRPGGVMLIGLYSRLGREAVIAAQDVAKSEHYPPTRDGILRFRRESPRLLDAGTLRHLIGLRDYYHLSMYRDLLFPAREQRFDLLRIQDILSKLGLSFEGFYVSADVTASYRAMFPRDATATDLDNWNRFEFRYPQSFASMYIFWCRKGGGRPGS